MQKTEDVLKEQKQWIKEGKAKLVLIGDCEMFATLAPCGKIEPGEIEQCQDCKDNGDYTVQLSLQHDKLPNRAIIASYQTDKEVAEDFERFVENLG